MADNDDTDIRVTDLDEDFETKLFRLIDAGHLDETIYFDFLEEDERIDLIAYIRIQREKAKEKEKKPAKEGPPHAPYGVNNDPL